MDVDEKRRISDQMAEKNLIPFLDIGMLKNDLENEFVVWCQKRRSATSTKKYRLKFSSWALDGFSAQTQCPANNFWEDLEIENILANLEVYSTKFKIPYGEMANSGPIKEDIFCTNTD